MGYPLIYREPHVMAPAKGGTQSRRTVVSAMGPVLDIGRGANAPRPGATAKTRLS